MMLVMDDVVDLEFWPRTKWCSAQAVLYRRGESAEPLLPSTDGGSWSPALRGMLIDKPLPPILSFREGKVSERTEWRRWVGATCLEEPHDVRRLPLHERPAFLRFCKLMELMVGGGAVDQLSEFGTELDQCVALTYLLDTPKRRRTPDRDLPLPADGVGAIFIGEDEPTHPRGGARAALRDLRHHVSASDIVRGVQLLEYAVAQLKPRYEFSDGSATGDPASPLKIRSYVSLKASLARGRGADLSPAAARRRAQELRAADHGWSIAVEVLNLSGFLNEADHRVWYPGNTREAGGWGA